jgi:hypothetical protein
MKSLQFSLILFQIGSLKENLPSLTLFIISLSDPPLNGGIPDKIMYVITPIDHISHLDP